MKKAFVIFVAVVLLAVSCISLADEVVNVYNWEDYIDPKVLELFEKETGIKVNYMRFTTNEDMVVQMRNSTGAFDVVFPSDYCIERFIAEDLLEELDFSKIPNAKHTIENLLNPDYDKENKYSVPYMWGTVGILYNKKLVKGEIDSWAALFSEEYKDNVFMLDSIRDTMGISLKYLGYSMNTRDPKHIKQATDLLIKQKEEGVVKAYQVDETKDKMAAGEAALALMWSGDAQYAKKLNPDLEYVVPKEGSNVWVDAIVIPKSAKNKENAHKFIDFLSRPDISKMNTEYIEYSTPNKESISMLGDEYTQNKTLNPDKETIDNCEFFHDINDFQGIYNTFWDQVKNAKIKK